MAFATSHDLDTKVGTPLLNLHPLFFGNRHRGGLLSALNITPKQDQELRRARTEIRQELRIAARSPESFGLDQSEVFRGYGILARLDFSEKTFRPRFLTQGSYVYKTLNSPCWAAQAIDLDDGVYFPMSFLDVGQPALMSSALFKLVENALESLCRRNSWTMTRKTTCVRIHLDPERTAHIDLPIYAIPDQEFERLEKSAQTAFASGHTNFREAMNYIGPEMRIDPNRVMLAHREVGWIPSDPQKMNDWVKIQIETHGESLRRAWRYLKAWRDFHWNDSSLASIHLMVAVAKIFDEHNEQSNDRPRDDIDLYFLATLLPNVLTYAVENPVDRSQPFRCSDQDHLIDLKQRMHRLSAKLYSAVYETAHKQLAIQTIVDQFGDRVPNDELMVSSNLGTPAVVSDRGQIRTAIAASVPIETVRKTHAG